MNIEIANRLVNLRKSNNLSQEALAEKLGISRQAVSKWERAEASPDTDNLILLARLYGVSLDTLLQTEDEIPTPEYIIEETSSESVSENKEASYEEDDESQEYVHVGFSGIHVKDEESEVHVGWNGIHVDDKRKNENVHIDKNGVYVNGEKRDNEWISHHAHFPSFLLVLVIYIFIGCVWNAWHPGWLLFFAVPVWTTFVSAVRNRNASLFAYPVLATLLFLCLGFFKFLWHPGWVVFLTIPLYYSLAAYFADLSKRRRKKKEEGSGAEYKEEEYGKAGGAIEEK